MIEEQKIEEAAKNHANEQGGGISIGDYTAKQSFQAGAHWAIGEFLKGLWHDAKEEPEKGKKLLGYDIDGYSIYCWTDQEATWKAFVYNTVLVRWLYIDELTKKGGSDD